MLYCSAYCQCGRVSLSGLWPKAELKHHGIGLGVFYLSPENGTLVVDCSRLFRGIDLWVGVYGGGWIWS
jgi:hypothetical protein